METAIISLISSFISAAVAIVVCIINANANNKKWMAEMDKRDSLQAYRIEQLEKKVDIHNNVIDRTYHLEERSSIHDENYKNLDRRVDRLEKIKTGG